MLDDIFSSNLDQELFDAICEPSFNLSDIFFPNTNFKSSDNKLTQPKVEIKTKKPSKSKSSIPTNVNTNFNTNINTNTNSFRSEESDFSESDNDNKTIICDLKKTNDLGICSKKKQHSQTLVNERKLASEYNDQQQGQVNCILEGERLGSDLILATRSCTYESTLKFKAVSNNKSDLESQTKITHLKQDPEQESEYQVKRGKSDSCHKKVSKRSKIVKSGFKKEKC